jgi:hypothetical protein
MSLQSHCMDNDMLMMSVDLGIAWTHGLWGLHVTGCMDSLQRLVRSRCGWTNGRRKATCLRALKRSGVDSGRVFFCTRWKYINASYKYDRNIHTSLARRSMTSKVPRFFGTWSPVLEGLGLSRTSWGYFMVINDSCGERCADDVRAGLHLLDFCRSAASLIRLRARSWNITE